MIAFRRSIILVLCAVFLTACSFWRTVEHLGRSYPAVAAIDIFYAEKDIKAANYEYMGEVFLRVGNLVDAELESLLIEAAKKRGASAILITYNLTARPDAEGGIYSTPILRGRLIHYRP
jgi:hypothetical protein